MRCFAFLFAIAVLVTGCTPVKQNVEWSAVSGSRSDATVKLAYRFTGLTDPNPDIAQAIHLAKSRCASWGYASAELFGGGAKECKGTVKTGAFGTVMCEGEWEVTKEFQCTGTGQGQTAPQPVVTEPATTSTSSVKKKK